MPLAKLPGVDIAYRLEGKADRPVLVLGNSLGTDYGMWDLVVPELTRHFRVLRFDARGHGASSTPKRPYTIDQFAKDTLALCDKLGIDRFAYCGLSLGGLIAQHLGLHYADRLTRLVVCNSAPALPPKENWDARIVAVTGPQGMGSIVDLAMQRFFSEPWRAKDEPIFSTMRTTFLATDPEGYAGACAAIGEADYTAELSKIKTPTLVVGGEFDASTPPAMGADVIAAKIPGAHKLILSTGHISAVEEPLVFAQALSSFVG
jgi:3-oxoadipate enol-lactonase